MIYWTWRQAQKSGASQVIIATESKQVQQTCEAFGAQVCLTQATHESGTERIAEVIEQKQLPDDTIIVNVQGDEPMLPPELIHQVAEGLKMHPNIEMATLCEPIICVETVFDTHAVKVSRDVNQCAINFSRAALPWSRDTFDAENKTLPENWHYKRHIGEMVEKLEQLRVLWQGEKILVLDALCDAGVGVDTEADLQAVRQQFQQKQNG